MVRSQRLPATTGDVVVTTIGLICLTVISSLRITGIGFRPRPEWAELALNFGLAAIALCYVWFWWRSVKSWLKTR